MEITLTPKQQAIRNAIDATKLVVNQYMPEDVKSGICDVEDFDNVIDAHFSLMDYGFMMGCVSEEEHFGPYGAGTLQRSSSL